MFDEERAEDAQGQQVLNSEDVAAGASDERLEGLEPGAGAPTGRFSPEEAKRRPARRVQPRSIALAPPPPGP